MKPSIGSERRSAYGAKAAAGSQNEIEYQFFYKRWNSMFDNPLQPFPDPEDVFSGDVTRHAKHLNPLASIDASLADKGLKGRLHIVSSIEPCDGYLGDSGREYWGGFLQPNWIGFRVTDDQRYELAGDFRFFAIENIDGEESYLGAREELKEFYDRQHRSYTEKKGLFAKTRDTSHIDDAKHRPLKPLSALGGLAPAGNMTWIDLENSSFSYSDRDAAPRTKDGRLFTFIASARGWDYREFGADEILLYYDPVDRIALQSFVWG